jgi:hypothetical protein
MMYPALPNLQTGALKKMGKNPKADHPDARLQLDRDAGQGVSLMLELVAVGKRRGARGS